MGGRGVSDGKGVGVAVSVSVGGDGVAGGVGEAGVAEGVGDGGKGMVVGEEEEEVDVAIAGDTAGTAAVAAPLAGCKAARVGVAAGGGASPAVQPADRLPTASSASSMSAHLRCHICQTSPSPARSFNPGSIVAASATFGARRRATSLLPAAAGAPGGTSRLAAQHVRRGKLPALDQRASTVGTIWHARVGAHQDLHQPAAIRAAVFIDRHQPSS